MRVLRPAALSLFLLRFADRAALQAMNELLPSWPAPFFRLVLQLGQPGPKQFLPKFRVAHPHNCSWVQITMPQYTSGRSLWVCPAIAVIRDIGFCPTDALVDFGYINK